MTKATEAQMSQLHGKVAETILATLNQAETAAHLLCKYPEMPDAVKTFLEHVTQVHPSLLTVATKFLKDNNISCDGASDTTMQELEEQLKKNRKTASLHTIPFE